MGSLACKGTGEQMTCKMSRRPDVWGEGLGAREGTKKCPLHSYPWETLKRPPGTHNQNPLCYMPGEQSPVSTRPDVRWLPWPWFPFLSSPGLAWSVAASRLQGKSWLLFWAVLSWDCRPCPGDTDDNERDQCGSFTL